MDKSQVIAKLLEMSNGQWPFTVIQVGDVIEISYNLADSRWIEFFGVGGHNKALKLLLKFDEAKKQVKYTLVEGSVTFSAGVPSIQWQASGFRGQKWGFSASVAYGVNTEGEIGKLYGYTVNYDALPNDIKQIVEPLGWTVVRDFSDPSTMIAIIFAFIGGLGAILTLGIFALKFFFGL